MRLSGMPLTSRGLRERSRLLGGILAALGASACIGAADAPAPAGVAPFVDAARATLERNHDGIARFAFTSARCRADRGVVLMFEQHGLLGSEGAAFALSGSPAADAGAWGGGFGVADVANDPEIRLFLQSGSEVPCR